MNADAYPLRVAARTRDGEHHADIYVRDAHGFDHNVARVNRYRGRLSLINWSSWGDMPPRWARTFAGGLEVTLEIAEQFDSLEAGQTYDEVFIAEPCESRAARLVVQTREQHTDNARQAFDAALTVAENQGEGPDATGYIRRARCAFIHHNTPVADLNLIRAMEYSRQPDTAEAILDAHYALDELSAFMSAELERVWQTEGRV